MDLPTNYNYFRDYDPTIGRYIESDPIGLAGGDDTFAYALLSPLDVSDFSGLAPDGCMTCIVYGEAGGTSDDCQEAVAAVINNRIADSKHFPGQNTPCAVASARTSTAGQEFDAYNSRRYKGCLSGCQSPSERYAADRGYFNSFDPIDRTNGSTYFHDKRIKTPKWIVRKIKSGEMVEQRGKGCRSFRFYSIVK